MYVVPQVLKSFLNSIEDIGINNKYVQLKKNDSEIILLESRSKTFLFHLFLYLKFQIN